QGLVRPAAERTPGDQAGRTGSGGRSAQVRPQADRHPVHLVRAHRGSAVREAGQPGDLAAVSDPRAGRPATRTRGCLPAPGPRDVAGRVRDDCATERPAASLTFLIIWEPGPARALINCICKCMYKALMNTILQSLAVPVRHHVDCPG